MFNTFFAAGDATLQQMAECLKQHSAAVAQRLPGLLAAAAIRLHTAAQHMLQGCFGVADGQPGRVQLILEGLHEALQQSECDDGVLRGCIALRLAGMLQQQQELDSAITIVQQVCSAVQWTPAWGVTLALACAHEQHMLVTVCTLLKGSCQLAQPCLV